MKLDSVAVGFGTAPIAPVMTALGLDYAATPWQRRDSGDAGNWHHDVPLDRRWWGTYLVRARSLAEARSLLPLLRSEGKAQRFVLVIEGHAPHQDAAAWTSRHLATKAQAAGRIVPGLGFATVIDGGKWVPIHAAATAALAGAGPAGSVPVLGGIRAGVLEPGDRSWLAGDTLASLVTPDMLSPDDDDIFAVDVIVGQLPRPLPRIEGRVTPQAWVPRPHDLPPVDTAVISPQGFNPYADGPVVDLAAGAALDAVAFTGPELASLRNAAYVSIDGTQFAAMDRALARRLAELSVAGVPLLASHLSAGVEAMLGDTLVRRIASFDPADPPVQRESKSIELRRAAIEEFAPRQRWNRVLQGLGLPLAAEPTVSVLLATRRPDKVGSALAQIARQSWQQLEVVLVLHGFDQYDPAAQQAIAGYQGQLTVLSVPSQTIFGDVLNAGTKVAAGDYLTKMDDDDWYGPDHIRDLVRSAEYSGAQLVGAQVEFVYLEALDITTRRPPLGEQYSDHVAGGTMLLRLDDLRRLGGWRPVHRAVDRCLLQAVLAADGLIYRSHGQNYLMHRHSAVDSHGGHTWNPDDSTFLQSVAEQWDGFVPPPQIQAGPLAFAGRSTNFSSYFSTDNRG
ncbi:glycosyltransferase [Arthrobacter sp. ZBG10]|uniref:glycosyltransferase n=1 Tax=Arthrobacter sp. ZBG10 TaxID=1676590 RepID=UPI00068104B1|nr:glycosyltransferase [Arthrobacter sp. ZBG10]